MEVSKEILDTAITLSATGCPIHISFEQGYNEDSGQHNDLSVDFSSKYNSNPGTKFYTRIAESDFASVDFWKSVDHTRTVISYWLEDGMLTKTYSQMDTDYLNHNPGRNPDDFSIEKSRPATKWTIPALARLAAKHVREAV